MKIWKPTPLGRKKYNVTYHTYHYKGEGACDVEIHTFPMEGYNCESVQYLKKAWLVNALRKERLAIRKHLKDEAYKEEWRDLKVCEQLYSEFIYRLLKIK